VFTNGINKEKKTRRKERGEQEWKEEMKQGTKKEKAKDEDFRPTSASVCSFSVDVLSCALYLPSIQPAMC
jgi:hypothetical protein